MAAVLPSSDSADAGVRLSSLSPKYLHTNSTSHTWPFSAIAELIDNAYDPDVNASQLWIDVKKYNKHPYCLVFTDNGAGMGPEKLHKMLSFGFCDKVAMKGQHMPVGHYGNGFKSGSMRLGKDAIVFTKNGATQSVGFLSQTYLEATKAETIVVPIVTWDSNGKIEPKSDKDKALQDILTYSIFKYKEELLAEFAGIQNPSGTRIIIFNVRSTPDGKPEFDFSTSDDLRIPEDTDLAISKLKKQERQNHIPESDYSLRAYCAILYLRPRMQIILRGKKVRTTVITKSLSKTEVDNYRPSAAVREANTSTLSLGSVNKGVKITFGFSQNRNHYGIMMYHRNRLIKPYVRVGYQLRANNFGVGVVGVIECDFLQPTHNKQDFDYTKAYRACIAALGSKLNDYWNEKKGAQRPNSKDPIPEPVEVQLLPDQIWVQCDNPDCLKWRKLPDGTVPDKLPEKWYCKDNPNPNMRSCNIPEEKEEEIEQPYVKTQKKRLEKEMEDRKRREREAKLKQEQEAKMLQQQQQKELEKKEAELQRLRQQLAEMESNNETSILQSIEQNSAKQQQAIRQQVKGEQKSPQPLRIKVGPPHSSGFKSTPGRPISQASPLRTTMVTSQTSNSPAVLTPNRTQPQQQQQQQQQQPAIKVVKVFSSRPPPSSQAPTTGNKPLVQIVPSPHGNILQQNNTDTTTPKVVSVQSLQSPAAGKTRLDQSGQVTVQKLVLSSGHKIHLQTPISQHVTPVSTNSPKYQLKTVPLQLTQPVQLPRTPAVSTQNKLPVQHVGTPLTSPAVPSSYKPLESLKEVNRQATQASAVTSPVSAVIPEVTSATRKSPTDIRNQVTVSDRYRYIAPSPQTSAGAAVAVAGSTTPTSALPPQQHVQTSPVKSTAPVTVQSINPAPSQVLQVLQIKQEPKPSVPVPPLQQTPSNIQITQVHSGSSAVAASTVAPVNVKMEKVDTPLVNGIKRIRNDNDDVIEQPPKQKPRVEKEVIIIDDPTPPPPPEEEKVEPEINRDLAVDGVDKDLIIKLRKLSPEEQWIKLAKSAQQLRYLRDNVCKLLRVLVPEIDLGDRTEILDNTTVDDLLKQVLEANIQPPSSTNS